MKLTDTQLCFSPKPHSREDRLLELPANLNGGAAQKVVGKLLTERLVEEIRARGEIPVWRRPDQEGPRALRVTKRGLQVIQVDEETAILGEPQKSASSDSTAKKKGSLAKVAKTKSQTDKRSLLC